MSGRRKRVHWCLSLSLSLVLVCFFSSPLVAALLAGVALSGSSIVWVPPEPSVEDFH